MLSVVMVSYPRRQQLRRMMRAARFAGGGMIASVGAVLLARADYAGLGSRSGRSRCGMPFLRFSGARPVL